MAASASSQTVAQGQPQPRSQEADRQLLVARADGGWTITREMHEAPAPPTLAADGLLLREPEPSSADAASERSRLRALTTEEAARRALEEAIDFGRGFESPNGRN